MSSFDAGYDAEIKRRQQIADGAQVQSTSSVAVQKTSDKSVNVFDNKNVEESAKKLGLTAEQYLEIVNNPEFANLSLEEQVAYINKYKAEHNLVSTVPTQKTADIEAAVQPAAVAEAEVTAEEETFGNVTEAQTVAKTEQVETEKHQVYDFKKFNEIKNIREFVDVYVEEYAKNKFLYGDENNTKSLDEWNNLSEKQRKKLIGKADQEVRKTFGLKSNFAWNNFDGKRRLIANAMVSLQTANDQGISLSSFKEYDYYDQQRLEEEYLEHVQTIDKEKLSERDNFAIIINATRLEAIHAKLGVESYSLSVDETLQAANDKEINVASAIKDYLNNKNVKGEELSEEQLKVLTFLNKLNTGEMKIFGKRHGQRNNLLETYVNQFNKALTDSEDQSVKGQVDILTDKMFEKCKDHPQELLMLYIEALETANVPLIEAMQEKAGRNEEFQKLLAESNLSDVAETIASRPACVGRFRANYVKNQKELASRAGKQVGQATGRMSKDLSAYFTRIAKFVNNSDDDSFKDRDFNKECVGISPEIDQVVWKRGENIENPGTQGILVDDYMTYADTDSKIFAATRADNLHEDNQENAINKATEGEPEVTEAVIKDGTLTRLSSKAQVGTYATLQTRAEEQFPEKEAIELGKQLADQIPECAVENQLAMHKTAMGSKYEEVQTHAAGNVYKYDKSVQADAIKSVYETGNVKAIEAVNTQLSKCDAAAVQSVAKEVALQVAAMEERHAQEVATSVAKMTSDMDAARDPASSAKWSVETRQEKFAQYREYFVKATPLEKFRMISKLQGVWQKEVITHIATYCPELLSSLISSMGADLFQLQLTPEVKNKVMLEMLRVPDMQADALEFFKDNPNGFNANVKTTCAELLLDRKDSAIESQSIKNALPASALFTSEPDDFTSGGKVSNREYYGANEDLSFWKRDKLGRLMG